MRTPSCTIWKQRIIQLTLGGVIGLLVCTSASAQEDPVPAALHDRIEQLRTAGRLRIGEADIAAVRVLPEFYRQRNFHRAWTNPAAVNDLLRAIDDSETDGLMPQDYHRESLHHLQRQISAAASPPPQQLADLDLLLTDAFLRLSYHMLFGKVDPERLDPNWNLARDLGNLDPVLAIQDAIDSGAPYPFITSLKPQTRYYTALKETLMHYRGIASSGGWPTIPQGTTLRQGMTDARIPLLRQRLAVTGDRPEVAVTHSALFDEPLAEAVRRFQRRHHLAADGVVGTGTLTALNVPVEARIDQIRVNLERGRWVLHDLEDAFLIVNIAGFFVRYVKDRAVVWQSRVQVGKPYRKTPVFKSEMKYLVFNPTWTVPPTILAQDMLPAVQRHPSYLQDKNIRVLDPSGKVVDPSTLDWSQYTARNFPYTLRQDPGPDNALGVVKFIFPNKHFVFLHDTPSKSLFEKETRTFSSGCIRVDQPLALAERLLDDPATWNQARIAEVIQSQETQTVYLRQPLPVLLLYWTAMVETDDQVHFMPDVYDRDAAILEDLNAAFRLRQRDVEKR
jgi:murein L,D-transpeptidase YcbB/YkuD